MSLHRFQLSPARAPSHERDAPLPQQRASDEHTYFLQRPRRSQGLQRSSEPKHQASVYSQPGNGGVSPSPSCKACWSTKFPNIWHALCQSCTQLKPSRASEIATGTSPWHAEAGGRAQGQHRQALRWMKSDGEVWESRGRASAGCHPLTFSGRGCSPLKPGRMDKHRPLQLRGDGHYLVVGMHRFAPASAGHSLRVLLLFCHLLGADATILR